MTTEHTLRAAGAERSFQKFILGKFPGTIPDLRGPGPWRLSQDDKAKEWLLQGGEAMTEEDDSAIAKFRGVPDAGLAGSSASSNYFILIKQRGSDDFLAIPVSEQSTFKPIQRRTQLSLEDAEAQMKFRRQQAERANPSIAQAIGDDDTGAGAAAAAATTGGDDEADSDDEWKDIKARAASLTAMRAGGANKTNLTSGNKNNTNQRRGGDGNEEDANDDEAEALGIDGAVYVPKPRDAEDWEHEGEAADDDLDMGGGSEGEVDVSPARGPAYSDSDGEDDMDAAKVKKALRRLMKETGLVESEASEELSEEGEDEEDEEDEGDLDDLDRMASEMLPKAPADAGAGGEASKKRKSPPPGSETQAGEPGGSTHGYTPVSRAVEDAAVAATAAKKARTAAAVPSPPISPSAAVGPPTEADVIALVKSKGRMLLKDLSNAFMGRLKTPEERQNFSRLVKKVITLLPPDEQGRKYVVVKQGKE